MIHFILPGETLQSISADIQLENPEYLKEYHNERCGREDIIKNELLPGKKLLIPDLVKIKEYNSRNDAPFKRQELNPKLHFKPEGLQLKYMVRITEGSEKENGSVHTNLTTFEATLQWIRKDGDYHVFHLSKDNFRSENGGKMGDLAAQCIQSLNPVEIRTDSEGKVVKISLTKEIADHFKQIKERLSDLFSDQYAALYIEEFEFAVQNEKLFDERMKEDTFIKIYFASIRKAFKNAESVFDQSLTYENIPVKIVQKVEDINYSEEITLLQNLQNRDSQSDMDYKGKYTLKTSTGIISKAEISYNISQVSVKYITDISVEEMN